MAKDRLLREMRWELHVVCRTGFVEEELAYLMKVLVTAITRGWVGTEAGTDARGGAQG